MAANATQTPPSMEELMAKDPSLIVTGDPDDANAETPVNLERHGEAASSHWIPLYMKPQRTPTRKLRILCIGGGMAAVTLAYKVYHEWSDTFKDVVELQIYEAEQDLGGTWNVNRYPGVSSDVPAHIYSFPFAPNPDWSAFYAPGAEIFDYIKNTVAKYGLDRDLKCGHRVSHAQWNEGEAKWHLRVDTAQGFIQDTCDVLVSAVGWVSKWEWPDVQGLQNFKGELMHSASWNASFDSSNKRIGVIGNGSSAIQLIPHLVESCSHLTNFVRQPTYITAGLGSGIIGGKAQHHYTDEEKQTFRENPAALLAHRKDIQTASTRFFGALVKGSEAQAAARKFTASRMLQKLGNDEDLARKMIPDWEFGCRRATPGPGYLEAFLRSNVSLVTERISHVSETGIHTRDNVHHPLDAIICATGFDVSHRPAFPLIGRNNVSLSEQWKDEPKSYLSICVNNFPNYFTFAGPNTVNGHGATMPMFDWVGSYICQWIKKISQEDIKCVEVKEDVLEEFNTYSDEIMKGLVWSGGCQSWYKNHRPGGRVTAVWAGSAISFYNMVEDLRPEDFDIIYRSRNRFRFMGQGRSRLEYDPNGDLAFYLKK